MCYVLAIMRIKITIAIISVLGIGCASTKTFTPTSEVFDDLNYDDYRSSIDTNFNYAEDIIEFFPRRKQLLAEERK